ncbi:Uncharacterised protein [Mycobacteroides abscessus subsp. abscessus]|nr:Uncharacterised protein [Mycobacteroides abscessus subsp. abscessus]
MNSCRASTAGQPPGPIDAIFDPRTSNGGTAIVTMRANGDRPLRARALPTSAPQSWPMYIARSSPPRTV